MILKSGRLKRPQALPGDTIPNSRIDLLGPLPYNLGSRQRTLSMHRIRKHIVTDEDNHPVAVQIDYEDWRRIEDALCRAGNAKPPTDLSRHIGKLDWPVDGLEYQGKVRSEWS